MKTESRIMKNRGGNELPMDIVQLISKHKAQLQEDHNQLNALREMRQLFQLLKKGDADSFDRITKTN